MGINQSPAGLVSIARRKTRPFWVSQVNRRPRSLLLSGKWVIGKIRSD